MESFSFSVRSLYYICYWNGKFITLPKGKIIVIKYAMTVKLTDLDSSCQHIRKELFLIKYALVINRMCFRRQPCLRILPTKLLEAVTKWKRKPQSNLRCKQITLSADPVQRIRNSKWLTDGYRFGSCYHQHNLILQNKQTLSFR